MYGHFLDTMLGECTLKEPFAVRHQEFLVYAFAKETFSLLFFSVTFSDPNFKKNTGEPFWNPLVPLKTKQKPANTGKSVQSGISRLPLLSS